MPEERSAISENSVIVASLSKRRLRDQWSFTGVGEAEERTEAAMLQKGSGTKFWGITRKRDYVALEVTLDDEAERGELTGAVGDDVLRLGETVAQKHGLETRVGAADTKIDLLTRVRRFGHVLVRRGEGSDCVPDVVWNQSGEVGAEDADAVIHLGYAVDDLEGDVLSFTIAIEPQTQGLAIPRLLLDLFFASSPPNTQTTHLLHIALHVLVDFRREQIDRIHRTPFPTFIRETRFTPISLRKVQLHQMSCERRNHHPVIIVPHSAGKLKHRIVL